MKNHDKIKVKGFRYDELVKLYNHHILDHASICDLCGADSHTCNPKCPQYKKRFKIEREIMSPFQDDIL